MEQGYRLRTPGEEGQEGVVRLKRDRSKMATYLMSFHACYRHTLILVIYSVPYSGGSHSLFVDWTKKVSRLDFSVDWHGASQILAHRVSCEIIKTYLNCRLNMGRRYLLQTEG